MNVDISKTKEYYHCLTEASLCDCAYCHSYRLQAKAAFPKASEYLASLGVDIEKPFETLPLEPNEDGMLEYCGCQYVVFGSCKPDYHHKIDNLEFSITTTHPSTGIEDEHFVLEMFPIELKFIEKA